MHSTPQRVHAGDFERLARLLADRGVVVLSGAGCSTDSGIPDYRDGEGAWKRTPPMQYREFIGSRLARQRYWARALIGWRQFRDVSPNAAHEVLARLELAGFIDCLVTQNVDGLHQRAGSGRVIDLHGRVDTVECLNCRRHYARETIQQQLTVLNPEWAALHAEMAPDGDALLTGVNFQDFRLADCEHCGGSLKPAVVFFGEHVPQEKVARAFEAVAAARALLVVGSSLMVFSGYRFVRAAKAGGIPVAIINLGRTRADGEVAIKIEARCGEALMRLEAKLTE